jgi:hypothetical protein
VKKKTVKQDDVRYIACAIENILNLSGNDDLDEDVSQFVTDNEERVAKIDWTEVSAEKILDDKDFRKYLLGVIGGALEELQAHHEEALKDRVHTSLDDYESQTGIRPSKKLIADAVREYNYNHLPPKSIRGVIKDLTD